MKFTSFSIGVHVGLAVAMIWVVPAQLAAHQGAIIIPCGHPLTFFGGGGMIKNVVVTDDCPAATTTSELCYTGNFSTPACRKVLDSITTTSEKKLYCPLSSPCIANPTTGEYEQTTSYPRSAPYYTDFKRATISN
jgi:hypothetical protein